MVQFKKRIGEDEDEIGLVYRRRPKQEPEVERKLDGNRFPPRADGSPALGFATLSHSNIKSLAKLAKAQGHNTRAIETPNAREGAPEPIELLEEKTGSYRDRLKAVLDEHEVPFHFRQNGTIATEDIYGASPEYWNRDGDWKQKPIEEIINDPVVQACLALARRKHGKKLISCSLHVDEESPHIHVVAVPLVRRLHATRGRKPKDCPVGPDGKPIDPRPSVEKYSLDVTSERGLSRQLERNHDEWADACKDIGLVRGERGSDMTEEQRRARRNRQTGRASMAEKQARQQRELIILDAQMGAVVIVDDAIKEHDRIIAEATRQFDEKIEAAAAISRTIAEGSDRLIAETQQENESARKLREEAEAAKQAAETAKTESERLKAAQASRESELVRLLAEAQADRAEAAADRKKAAQSHAAQQKREAELAEALAAIDNERRHLKDDRDLYEKASDALLKSIELAIEFRKAWDGIPPAQRTPLQNAALEAATALTIEDLPLGFGMPYQGRDAGRD